MPTERAGHAEQLAREFASAHPRGMVISSSGDGGYHEVINGVLTSAHPRVITGVLPSGNANDHYHFVHHGRTLTRIADGDTDEIDVLRVKFGRIVRYAHSYAGLGATPQIGEALTKAKLNPLRETWFVITSLVRVRPVVLRVGGVTRRYDSIIWSNTGRMSKYLTLARDASIDDGMMEITRTKSASLWSLAAHFLRRAAKVVDEAPQAEEFTCIVVRATSIQLDGEVYDIDAGNTLTITCERRKLRTIV